MHRISRETLRKHAIDSLPWEGTDDDLTGRTNSNKKAKMTTNDGAILRPEERNAIARDVSISSDSRVQPPPYKTTGMNSINNDEVEIYNITPSSLFLNSNDIDKFRKPSEPKVNNMRTNRDDKFFARVDELKAYKDKHGHLNVRKKEDKSLYDFCYNVRRARRDTILGKGTDRKLTKDRIAALDAIGFDWEARASSTAASQDDRFLDRVEELRAYKAKHGPLKVKKTVDLSLHKFCNNVRQARRAIITGKGTYYKLTEDRIAALDAIGFIWNPLELEMSSTSPSAMSKSSHHVTSSKINVGDVGYQFRKEFDSGWYHGTVVEILQDADDGWDRRCVYEDGDCEDLSLSELKRLATLSPQEHVGAIEVVGDVKMVEDGGMKVAATEWASIPAVKERAVMNVKEEECLKSSNPNVDNPKLKRNINFFDRVDELKAYKEKHGHLHVSHKEDKGLYSFCCNTRHARRNMISGHGTAYKLTDDRIAALDTIGFNWNPGTSSTAATKDDKFFGRVDELRAYKDKHGHLDVGYKKEDKSLYNYCCLLRSTRRDIISGKGTRRILTEDRIAALDAIGFNWNPGTSSTAATKDDKFFGRVDELRAYKDKHGHLNVSHKVDPRLYHFCCDMRAARKGKTAGKGKKGSYRLDETRITALDAIGFNWDPQGLNLSSTLPSAVTSKSTQQATNPKINIGDVGYQFLKEFDSGWYHGKVVEILPHADDGWDRRCIYEDGDCEDLALSELKRLATLSPQEHVGAIEVVGDVKMVDDGGMKVAASVGESILAAKVNPVIQKAARLKQRPVSKTTTSSMDDLLLTKNSKSSSNNNKAMATDLASLSSVNYDDLTIRELKQVPELTQHIVAIEEVLRNMRRG
jgi:hypothetical protein